MKSTISALVLAVLGGLSPSIAAGESLGDALASAYKSSNLLKQQQATLRAADEGAAAATATLRPVIDFTISGQWKKYDNSSAAPEAGLPTPNFETSFGMAQLSASMLIWGNGRGQIGRDLARENVRAVRAALVSVEQDVLMQAVAAYVDVLRQGEIMDLRQGNVRLITKQLRAAKERFDLGDATQTDIAWAEARLAGAQAQLAAADAGYRAAVQRYAATTGMQPGRLARLPKAPHVANSLEEASAIARQSHPLVLQSQHFARIAELQVDLAEAGLGPMLTGQAGIERSLNSGITDQFASLQFKQTLYKGGEAHSDYRKAFANKEAAAAGLMQAQLSVQTGVTVAWNNLRAAATAIEAGELQVRATEKALEGVRKEAELGSKTTLDVLDAEQELMNARVQLTESRANRYLASYQLLAAVGRLTVTHLGLGVPVYDPDVYSRAVEKAPVTSPQGEKLDRILKKLDN